jgi:mono/diheme cytochrome c family protein
MQKTTSRIGTILVVAVTAAFTFLSAAAQAQPEGESLYKAKCAACHGADGKGETTVGKANKVRDLGSADVQKQTDDEIAGIINNGKAKMPAYGKSVKPEQVKDLVAYIRGLKK